MLKRKSRNFQIRKCARQCRKCEITQSSSKTLRVAWILKSIDEKMMKFYTFLLYCRRLHEQSVVCLLRPIWKLRSFFFLILNLTYHLWAQQACRKENRYTIRNIRLSNDNFIVKLPIIGRSQHTLPYANKERRPLTIEYE